MMHITKLLKNHQLTDIKDSDANGDTILHLVIKNEELTPQEKILVLKDIVKIILEKGISLETVDKTGNTALHVAITENENIKIVKMLIKHSKDINCKNLEGETPFYTSINNCVRSGNYLMDYNVKVLQSLIAKGANVNEPNKYGLSPLCNAVQTHHLPTVKFLDKNGADFNVITNEGETLLHLLAKKYSYSNLVDKKLIKLFDMLISHGCKVNARDRTGKTALHTAAQHCDAPLVQKLIENGAHINCKNNFGKTPLCFYVHVYNSAEGNEIRSRFLLREYEAGELQALYPCDLTSLFRSRFIYPYIQTLELLLKHGADFNAKFNNGYSILHMALWENYNHNVHKDNQVAPEDLPKLTECLSILIRDKVRRLLIHWIKLEVANLRCDTGFEYADLMEEEEYKKIDQKCRNEIKILKDTFIDSRTTLYTLLHMDLNSRRAYLNNEKLQNILQSPKFEKEYPEYWILMFSSYQEVLTRKSLMDPAKKTWLELTEIQLPELCIELIFSFLSNAELFDFIEGI